VAKEEEDFMIYSKKAIRKDSDKRQTINVAEVQRSRDD
jgi:hypothetical protein